MATMARRLLSLGATIARPQWPMPGSGLRALFPARTWAIVLGTYLALAFLVPILNLAVPVGSALHVSDYWVTLAGKILCYATVALAMDLVWGYAGILSLGHGLFFALGGYAMGMYLMRAIGTDGVYGSTLPDFMVFLDWKALPWYWRGSDSFLQQAAMVVLVPSLLAFVFGWFAFRSRIRGVASRRQPQLHRRGRRGFAAIQPNGSGSGRTGSG